jgi:hypothetical protein
MKRPLILLLIAALMGFLSGPAFSQNYIAGHHVARESVLRSIPEAYINAARTELVISYQHTSHGTHVSRGVFGLQDYKSGDNVLFGVSESPSAGLLEFRDNELENYAPAGVDAADLSRNETAFIQTTRNYLDAPENASVNVIMWAWCNIADHDVAGNYLPGMAALISEYGEGGSKIGTGQGQRELPVSFIFMTGHANRNANTGDGNPMEQAELIINYCKANAQFCLDYYSIDTHTMGNTYFEDTGDDGDSDDYGGNFYRDWQHAGSLGQDYYENKVEPGGRVDFGEHNTQHITANRKAYAFWWILARIAGWAGDETAVEPAAMHHDLQLYPNPGSGIFHLEFPYVDISSLQVLDGLGREVVSLLSGEISSPVSIDLSGHSPGIYVIRVRDSKQHMHQSKVLLVE